MLTESITSMSTFQYAMILFAIMLISGVLGGYANYYIENGNKKKAKRASPTGYIVLGIVAAFVVPLFLNMISSDLLKTGQTNPLNLFVFCGFSLLAAVFSKNFLQSLYDKILKQLEEVKEDIEEDKDARTEPEDEFPGKQKDDVIVPGYKGLNLLRTPENPELVEPLEQIGSRLSPDEKKVFESLGSGKYTYRSLSGITKETELSREIVFNSLKSLVSSGLAIATTGKQNQYLWYLSDTGKRLLN